MDIHLVTNKVISSQNIPDLQSKIFFLILLQMPPKYFCFCMFGYPGIGHAAKNVIQLITTFNFVPLTYYSDRKGAVSWFKEYFLAQGKLYNLAWTPVKFDTKESYTLHQRIY